MANGRCDAREELARAEGLGDVVVCTHLDAGNGGELVARSGEEDDRELRQCLLERRADGESVALGQGHVEKHERIGGSSRTDRGDGTACRGGMPLRGVRTTQGKLDSLVLPRGVVDRVPLAHEKLGERLDDDGVIFDQQYARCHSAAPTNRSGLVVHDDAEAG